MDDSWPNRLIESQRKAISSALRPTLGEWFGRKFLTPLLAAILAAAAKEMDGRPRTEDPAALAAAFSEACRRIAAERIADRQKVVQRRIDEIVDSKALERGVAMVRRRWPHIQPDVLDDLLNRALLKSARSYDESKRTELGTWFQTNLDGLVRSRLQRRKCPSCKDEPHARAGCPKCGGSGRAPRSAGRPLSLDDQFDPAAIAVAGWSGGVARGNCPECRGEGCLGFETPQERDCPACRGMGTVGDCDPPDVPGNGQQVSEETARAADAALFATPAKAGGLLPPTHANVWKDIRAVVARLSGPYRYILYDLIERLPDDGSPVAELAETLGMTPYAVKTARGRIKRSLREVLESHGVNVPPWLRLRASKSRRATPDPP